MTNLPHQLQDDVSSPSSSIPVWLDAHPDLPHQYEFTDTTASETTPAYTKKNGHVTEVNQPRRASSTSGHKRRELESNSREGSRSKGRKRRPLGAIIANSMAPDDVQGEHWLRKKQGSDIQPPQQRSSRRRPKDRVYESPHRTRSSQALKIRDDDDSDTDEDEIHDEDPTPKALSWGSVPVLPPPGSDTSSLHSSKPGHHARSNSPSKRGDLQLSSIKVRILEGMPTPTDGNTLWRDLRRIGKGFQVLPLALKEKSIQELEDDPDDADRYFDPNAKGKGEKVGHNGLNYEETWGRVIEIHGAALDCRNKALAEPGWNSEVHSSLLNLALRGECRSKGIWYRDVTTARIRDKSLLDLNQQSKIVDYALVIEHDFETEGRLQDMMVAKGMTSLNHIDSEYLRFVPISVSMETKRAAIDEDKAEVQVCTWIKAHYAKLKQLAPNAASMPVLPIIIAQGHHWTFMLADMAASDQVIIHRDLSLGATNTIIGIYQLLHVVRRLARWTHEVYEPWFMKEVLQPGPVTA